MAKKQSPNSAITVELKNVELQIEKLIAARTAKIEKAAKAFAEAMNTSSDGVSIETKIESLRNSLLDQTVDLGAEVKSLELRIEEAQFEYDEKVKSLATNLEIETAKLEKRFSDLSEEFAKKVSILKEDNLRELENIAHEHAKNIREKGDVAFKQYLTERSFVAVDKVAYDSLSNYKRSSEETIQSRIDAAILEVKNQLASDAKHANDMVELRHANELALKDAAISSLEKQLAQVTGYNSFLKKKDEEVIGKISDIVKNASQTVSNTINQKVAD